MINNKILQVYPSKVEDAKMLAPRLRKTDINEIQLLTEQSPLTVLEKGIVESIPCYTVTSGDKLPIAIFGVVPDKKILKNSGIVWLLASDDILKHSVSFLRNSGKWINKLHNHYYLLWNYIDARNKVYIKWLKCCGFNFSGYTEKYGIEKRTFYKFEKYRVSLIN